jgi:hypothetical protein
MSHSSAHLLDASAVPANDSRSRPAADDTLAALHLACERRHDRTAVLESWVDGRWQPMPDWRFFRHVVRVGLYFRERLALNPGDRIALVGPPSAGWLVADWAAVSQGLVSVVVDPEAPAGRWTAIAPRVAFVEDAGGAERLLGVTAETLATIVTFDPFTSASAASVSRSVVSFTEVLDLGGTLDTAERAGAFRAQARQVGPDAPAMAHAGRAADASAPLRVLTHGEIVARIRRAWSVAPPRPDRAAYVSGRALSLAEHVALYGRIADGFTRTILGAPGQDEREHPSLSRPAEQDGANAASRVRHWLAFVARWRRHGRSR